MAARKLKQIQPEVNQQQQPAGKAETSTAPNLVAISAAVWESIGKIAGKENRRDDIPDGFAGKVELYIAARIDNGPVYRQNFAGQISVGHASQRATSSLPNMGEVIGHILAQLNGATREAILRDLPAIYAANNGELPAVPKEIEEAAEGLLGKLRATKQIDVRGSVSVKYEPAAPALGLVG